jgi:hypothetical protein
MVTSSAYGGRTFRTHHAAAAYPYDPGIQRRKGKVAGAVASPQQFVARFFVWRLPCLNRLAVVPLELAVRAAPIRFLPAPGYGIVAYILREGTGSLF